MYPYGSSGRRRVKFSNHLYHWSIFVTCIARFLSDMPSSLYFLCSCVCSGDNPAHNNSLSHHHQQPASDHVSPACYQSVYISRLITFWRL